ncbi:SDR family NAD(P)-dependent oxidoreductase [Maribacter sp. 2-571]|uniref:SDR family NAD(P)-dependent oxidoreductase n=1 Tax=Maribacter sp. 2-571 TaxID=3417569 RepID=UPI003D354BBD
MIHFSYDGKVAIITGAAIGIGFEIAKMLSNSGASLVLNDIDDKALERAIGEIRAHHGKCSSVVGDSGDLEVIQKMVRTAIADFGKLDFVIANSGITTFGDFIDYKLENFQKLTSINLQGSFFLAQAATKQFIEQETGGRIIFMSSVTGHRAHPKLSAYGMTKAALEMLAKSLSVELAKYKITVNAVAPGATLTERTQSDENYKAIWEEITPTGIVSTTSDIAKTILFLLADSSGQITGQTIIVDGGWTSVSPPPKES